MNQDLRTDVSTLYFDSKSIKFVKRICAILQSTVLLNREKLYSVVSLKAHIHRNAQIHKQREQTSFSDGNVSPVKIAETSMISDQSETCKGS